MEADIPHNAPEGFLNWLKFIKVASNNPEHELSAGDIRARFDMRDINENAGNYVAPLEISRRPTWLKIFD